MIKEPPGQPAEAKTEATLKGLLELGDILAGYARDSGRMAGEASAADWFRMREEVRARAEQLHDTIARVFPHVHERLHDAMEAGRG